MIAAERDGSRDPQLSRGDARVTLYRGLGLLDLFEDLAALPII